MGWFGMIVEVYRKLTVEIQSGIPFDLYIKEPSDMKPRSNEKRQRRKYLLNRHYPFITNPIYPTTDLYVTGSTLKLSFCHSSEELKRLGIRTLEPESEAHKSNCVNAKILSCEVRFFHTIVSTTCIPNI